VTTPELAACEAGNSRLLRHDVAMRRRTSRAGAAGASELIGFAHSP
jgi:hypothetical protein